MYTYVHKRYKEEQNQFVYAFKSSTCIAKDINCVSICFYQVLQSTGYKIIKRASQFAVSYKFKEKENQLKRKANITAT